MDLLDTRQAYKARFQVSDPHGTYSGYVWHDHGRERRDVDTKVGSVAVLLRRDLETAYFLNLSAKWSVSFGFRAAAQLAGGLDDLVANKRLIGQETVAGQSASHYKIDAKGSAGYSFKGDLWATRAGIPLKAEGIATDPKGRVSPVSLVQSDIVLGAVPSQEFEVPSGLSSLDLRSVKPEQLIATIETLGPMLGLGK